jgi:hypothetical protein
MAQHQTACQTTLLLTAHSIKMQVLRGLRVLEFAGLAPVSMADMILAGWCGPLSCWLTISDFGACVACVDGKGGLVADQLVRCDVPWASLLDLQGEEINLS